MLTYWSESLFEEITFEVSLVAEIDVATQRARRESVTGKGN